MSCNFRSAVNDSNEEDSAESSTDEEDEATSQGEEGYATPLFNTRLVPVSSVIFSSKTDIHKD